MMERKQKREHKLNSNIFRLKYSNVLFNNNINDVLSSTESSLCFEENNGEKYQLTKSVEEFSVLEIRQIRQ